MKLVISLAALLVSAAAFAMPAVGDYSSFSLRMEQNGAFINGTYEIGLIEKDDAGNFKMQKTITMENQQPQAQVDSVASTDLLSDDVVTKVMDNCTNFGGTLGTYQGPGFSIPTCVIPQADAAGTNLGEIQIGHVPFGIAKQVQLDPETGRTITLALQKYTLGK